MTGRPVLVVDDHDLFAETLLLALRAAGLDAHRADRSPTTLLARAASETPIVLLDLDLGPDAPNGADLVAPLAEAGATVVVLTGAREPWQWGRCLAAGAADVLGKSSSLDEVVTVTRRAAAGQPVGQGEPRRAALAAWRDHRQQVDRDLAPLRRLTAREAQVLRHLVDGEPAGAIAQRAGVSEATVRSQIRAVLTKLGVRSQLAAAAFAVRTGWARPDTRAAPGRAGSGPAQASGDRAGQRFGVVAPHGATQCGAGPGDAQGGEQHQPGQPGQGRGAGR